MSVIVERKQGDNAGLSGTLDEETPLDAADWVGATAAINMKNAAGVLVLDHVPVTLNTGVTPKEVEYDGVLDMAPGSYTFEWEVTLAGAKKRTWPNYKAGKCTLKVGEQIA